MAHPHQHGHQEHGHTHGAVDPWPWDHEGKGCRYGRRGSARRTGGFGPARALPKVAGSPGGPRSGARQSDLVRTLEAYFEAGENASQAADRLFLHRNSIPYRLARVEELTGLDLKDHQATLALRLGLLATEEERRRHR